MATNSPTPQVSANDRLMFATFLAAVLHGLLILGLGITFTEQRDAAPSLDVTIARFQSETTPEDADFLAQFDQQGSGTEAEALAPSTTEQADFDDNEVRDIEPIQQQQSAAQQLHTEQRELTTQRSEHRTVLNTTLSEQPDNGAQESNVSLLARSLEIASLEAELRQQRQHYARRPRKRQLTSASTKSARDALYLDDWRQRIEQIGNLNYPSEARVNRIYGKLMLLVAVKADGSVHEVRVLRSSGHRILDDAAIRIVRLAEPFAPFPDSIAQDTDILEIIRTWEFTKNDSLTNF